MDLDSAILALEALAIRLETADSTVDISRLSEAVDESISVADAVLSPQESSMWRELAISVGGKEHAAYSSNVRDCSSAREPIASRCSNSRCGTFRTDEDLRKRCALDCGVRFCSSKCWRERRADHEGTCTVMRKKSVLRQLNVGTWAGEELF